MSRQGRFVVAASVVLFVVQAGSAGTAFWLRGQGQSAITASQARVAELQAEAERALPVPAVEVAPAPTATPWQLHDTSDVTGSIEMLQGLCDGTGTTVEVIKALPATTPGKQAFQIALHGVPRNVVDLLTQIEQNQRLLVLESGRVTPAGDGMVALEFAIATWYRGGRR
jgi:hypothetical protein